MAQQTSAAVQNQAQLDRNIGVIGLGIVGSATTQLAVEAGYRVLGYDSNRDRAVQVRATFGGLSCEIDSTPAVLAEADVVVIAVRASTGPGGVTDMGPLNSAWRTLIDLPARDRLVLIETTVPPGTTRRLASELPSARRTTTHIAHCPERLRVGDQIEQLRQVPRLVGGLTSAATRLGCEFIESLGVPAAPVAQPEVAELAKLLENAFLTTGIALMGEVARIAHALGVSAADVADAAETKPHGYYPFRPGPGIGGHCLVNDLRMLRGAAAALGIHSELIDGVQRAVDRLNRSALGRLDTLLTRRGQSLSGALIWLIGVGFKPGSIDSSGSPAYGLVRLLRERGCSVVFSDSGIDTLVVDDEPVRRAPSGSASFHPDAALLLSGDPSIELDDVAARCALILDLGGGRIMSGRPSNLERL